MPLGGTTSKATVEGPPSSKQWEVPPWYKVLKQSHWEVFSLDTSLVRVARKEYFKKHSPSSPSPRHGHLQNLESMEGTGWAVTKGLRFLQAVPPSESPKVLGLVGIHNPDALCHFSDWTHCPWCGKEGQNEGIVVNHLQMVHYRLGLVCNKCYDYPTTSSDTLCCHSWQNCLPTREGGPDESATSE